MCLNVDYYGQEKEDLALLRKILSGRSSIDLPGH